MDPLLALLLALLIATLAAFFAGLTPYPYGLLALLVFIAARVLYLRGE